MTFVSRIPIFLPVLLSSTAVEMMEFTSVGEVMNPILLVLVEERSVPRPTNFTVAPSLAVSNP